MAASRILPFFLLVSILTGLPHVVAAEPATADLPQQTGSPAPERPPRGGSLTRVEVFPGRAVLTLTGLEPKTRQLKMSDPPRLVLDLLDVTPVDVPNVLAASGGFDRIRVGTIDRKTRLVFDAPEGSLPDFKIAKESGQIVVSWDHASATGKIHSDSAPHIDETVLLPPPTVDAMVVEEDFPQRENLVDGQSPILPETTTPVVMSARDLNRISCQSPIQDLLFSSEKGIEGKFNGTSAFLKFKVRKSGDKKIYASEPVELFVVCDGAVYTLIATPREDVRAVTLRLQSPNKEELGKNLALFAGLPMSKKVMKLVTEAYQGAFPDSYTVGPGAGVVEVSPTLLVREIKRVSVPGEGLEVLELQARGNFVGGDGAPSAGVRELREADFVVPAIGEGILAVAVLDHQLSPGQATRVFVVRHKGGER